MSYALRDFGCYTAGGRIHRVAEGEPFPIQVTRDSSYLYDPRGHFAVEHAYVQFFIPERRNSAPPVVLVHGGGTHGATWETTPDGRPGWLHLLVRRGYEVHVVDAVERGRAGWMPGLWQGDPILRSMEEAWSLFRFGPPEGFSDRLPFPGQQFPVEHIERLARSLTPRWLSTSRLQIAALVAVLEKTGPAILVTHSQGGEIGFDAQALRPDLVAAIVAVEPSAAQPRSRPWRSVRLFCWSVISSTWTIRSSPGPSFDATRSTEAQPSTSQTTCLTRGVISRPAEAIC